LIKFGSRCDVLMPAEANLRVKVGTKVTGGSTVLAALTDGTTDAGSELGGQV